MWVGLIQSVDDFKSKDRHEEGTLPPETDVPKDDLHLFMPFFSVWYIQLQLKSTLNLILKILGPQNMNLGQNPYEGQAEVSNSKTRIFFLCPGSNQGK